MEHGGLLSFNKEKTELIDFSSNINPLGFPKSLQETLLDNFNRFAVYPDIKYRNLKFSVSKYLDCKAENILLGNGAVELIDNFCNEANRIIVCTPCFSEYILRAEARKKPVLRIPYLEDFLPDINSIEKNLQQNDLLILGNPNNPTGLSLKKEDVIKIYELVKAKNAFLLLDEAFFEFCPFIYDSIHLFKKDRFKNICIIRAATKFFALPGIRLAYACTSPEIAGKISRNELPWHINTAAEIAGCVIFEDNDYIQKSKNLIQEERKFLFENLNKYGKSSVIPMVPYFSECNFILIKLLKHSDVQAHEFFLDKNILIRTCSSFGVLGNNHIRIAVKSRIENEMFISAIKI